MPEPHEARECRFVKGASGWKKAFLGMPKYTKQEIENYLLRDFVPQHLLRFLVGRRNLAWLEEKGYLTRAFVSSHGVEYPSAQYRALKEKMEAGKLTIRLQKKRWGGKPNDRTETA
jgi:hypothetical protein